MFKIYSTFALILVLVASVPEEELKLAAEAYVPKDSREYAIFSGLAYCPKKCL